MSEHTDRSREQARALPRVALVMAAVGNLGSSGGAERQFSDLHEYLRRSRLADVTLITSRTSLAHLRQTGRLVDGDGIVVLPLGRRPARGWIGVAWLTLTLLCVTFLRRFDVIHLCLPTPVYVPFASVVSWLPRAVRPRIVLNIIDCTLAPNLASRVPMDLYERQVVDAHRLYFRRVRLDGIYTWYEAFVDVCRTQRLLPASVPVRAARFCFTDPVRFKPATPKEPLVVFAGRLSAQKRPMLFVEAVARLCRCHPDLIRGWRFVMYGGGDLERIVQDHINSEGLHTVLSLSSTPDLSGVFARSRLFVSTQALENFTSLAMLEAMAAGNAIIAEDVGQTREFVRDGSNGLLVTSARADAFADAVANYLRHPELHDAMAAASRRLATEVHNVANFASDLAAFWHAVIDVESSEDVELTRSGRRVDR